MLSDIAFRNAFVAGFLIGVLLIALLSAILPVSKRDLKVDTKFYVVPLWHMNGRRSDSVVVISADMTHATLRSVR